MLSSPKQFATENLLFAIEYLQFVALLAAHRDYRERTTNNTSAAISLPENFPLSEINSKFVTNGVLTDTDLLVYSIQKALFEKYIAKDAALEINIDHKLRGQMVTNFVIGGRDVSLEQNNIISASMELFERAFLEVGGMLAGSYLRFTASQLGNECLGRMKMKARSVGDILLRMQVSSIAN